MFGNLKGYIRLVKDARYANRRIRQNPARFDTVASYCMFIGYPRSSHSLVGSLIDAHPDAIIAHEQDALKYIKYGFAKKQLFELLLRNSREFTEKGRTWTGYSYHVPGQYQGRFENLRIIGDKRGANSVRRLQRKSGILEKLETTVGVPIKMIHVIRNPYDNISTIAFRNNGSDKEKVTPAALREEITNYFSLVETVARLQNRLGNEGILDIKIEDFTADPREKLRELCVFLGLEANEQYLNDCSAIVYNKPRKTRHNSPWDEELIQEVESRMKAYPFFSGYDFNH